MTRLARVYKLKVGGPVAQWQSNRLITGRSLVRTQPGPPPPSLSAWWAEPRLRKLFARLLLACSATGFLTFRSAGLSDEIRPAPPAAFSINNSSTSWAGYHWTCSLAWFGAGRVRRKMVKSGSASTKQAGERRCYIGQNRLGKGLFAPVLRTPALGPGMAPGSLRPAHFPGRIQFGCARGVVEGKTRGGARPRISDRNRSRASPAVGPWRELSPIGLPGKCEEGCMYYRAFFGTIAMLGLAALIGMFAILSSPLSPPQPGLCSNHEQPADILGRNRQSGGGREHASPRGHRRSCLGQRRGQRRAHLHPEWNRCRCLRHCQIIRSVADQSRLRP